MYIYYTHIFIIYIYIIYNIQCEYHNSIGIGLSREELSPQYQMESDDINNNFPSEWKQVVCSAGITAVLSTTGKVLVLTTVTA